MLFAAFLATGAVNSFLDLGMARSATDVEKKTGRTLITFLDIPAALGSLLGAGAALQQVARPEKRLVYQVCPIDQGVVLIAWNHGHRPILTQISDPSPTLHDANGCH